ncbi:uncharacterized protein KY384_004919 [Bacidia gigantensis]|uniref:uncharacterized protein n=1 Tax=Bacidia gigantensis TaxID=2732470 RepID=UPI001D059B35|nr:uncharacterized protein KY384_004919 [Bacidia gigantensis]KAG8530417.1 hypothetical protein KY384_004919 [Bacidia gigantensis]
MVSSSIYAINESAPAEWKYNQIGYTLVECLISAIYISSLIILLKLKSSVKQRRVMTDLIYVNGAVVSFDILTVILVFLNQTGISHPIQTCSYILKFKLEFMVLNQLMAVAARGIQKDSFAERRYHHPAISSEKESSSRSAASTKTPRGRIESFPDESTPGSVQELVVPSHALSKAQVIHDESHPQNIQDRADLGEWPLRAKIKEYRGNETDEEEDEDIGVHMWGRRGNMVMEVPWFREEHHN